MTDPLTPFMPAILARPDDDLPRLLAADALDEAGDPRGEFIRVQVELATFIAPKHPGIVACEDKQRLAGSNKRCKCRPCALRRRERELLEWHYYNWTVGLFPKGVRDDRRWLQNRPTAVVISSERTAVAVSFRRGFVAEITLPWADWQASSQAILDNCPIARSRDDKIVLTTQPAYSCGSPMGGADDPELKKRWPGVRFKLPPVMMIYGDSEFTEWRPPRGRRGLTSRRP